MEYISVGKRTFVVNLGLAVGLTLSGMYQPWLAKYLGHWKTFNWAIFSQVSDEKLNILVMIFVSDGLYFCDSFRLAGVMSLVDGKREQGENGKIF